MTFFPTARAVFQLHFAGRKPTRWFCRCTLQEGNQRVGFVAALCRRKTNALVRSAATRKREIKPYYLKLKYFPKKFEIIFFIVYFATDLVTFIV
jgi:hypothetical protein